MRKKLSLSEILHRLAGSFLILTYCSIIVPSLFATVRYVSVTTGNDGANGTSAATAKATIAAAISSAEAGDIIRVASGTYAESLTLSGKPLTFLGGYSTDFLARDFNVTCSTVTGGLDIRDTCTFDGFSFTNSSTNEPVSLMLGSFAHTSVVIANCTVFDSSKAGIYAAVSSKPVCITVSSCTIYNCKYGIYLGDGGARQATIFNNTIYHIRAQGDSTPSAGAGIYFANNDTSGYVITMDSNNITDCERYGIYGSDMELGPVIRNNRITHCSWAMTSGRAAIYYAYGNATIQNNVIARNSSVGIYLPSTTHSLIKNNTIADNGADGTMYGVGATYKNNIICGNGGSGINEQVSNAQSGEIAYNIFGANSSSEDVFINALGEPGLSFYKSWAHDNLYTSDASSLFVNSAADDYHLAANSLGIDAGDIADSVGAEPSPSGGRIDCGAYGGTPEATASEQIPPAAVADLSAAAGTNNGEIALSFTSPGDDGTSNRNIYGAAYLVRYSTSPINGYTTQQWWNMASEFTPQSPWLIGVDYAVLNNPSIAYLTDQPMGLAGKSESFTVYGLTPGVRYYFMLKTRDNSGNVSDPDEKSLSEATMATAIARSGADSVPSLGYSAPDVLNTGAERTDASDIVDIKFRVRDADGAPDTSTFLTGSAQYRLNGAWYDVNDAQVNFSSASFVPSTSFNGTEYTLSWDTKGTITNLEDNNVSFRFKVTDGTAESLFASTGPFTVDNKFPFYTVDRVMATTPLTATIGWDKITDMSFLQYDICYATYSFSPSTPQDANHVWTASQDSRLSLVTTTSTVITGLSMNTPYWFYVRPRDAYGHAAYGGYSPVSTTTAMDYGAPGPITDLTASVGRYSGQALLQWTAPGNDGATGNIKGGLYEIKCSSTDVITTAGYADAGFTVQFATSTRAGEAQSCYVSGLVPGIQYWFAIRIRDDANYWSVWSSSQDVPEANTGATAVTKTPGSDPAGAVFSGDFLSAGGAVYTNGRFAEAFGLAVDTVTQGGPYIYVGGYSQINGDISSDDCVLVKYDANGNKLLAQTFDGPAGDMDSANDLCTGPAGSIYMTGSVTTLTHGLDIVVQKYDPDLDLTASVTFNGAGNSSDEGNAVTLDRDGNVIVAGTSYTGFTQLRDMLVIKYTPDLATVLSYATFNSGDNDYAYGVAVDTDNNIFITGKCGNTPTTVKFNSSLVFVSSATCGTGAANESAEAAAIDQDGNVLVSGVTVESGVQKGMVVKYRSDLAVVLSSVTLGDAGVNEFSSVFAEPNGEIVAAGRINDDYGAIRYSPDLSTIIATTTYDSGTSDKCHAGAAGVGDHVYVTGNDEALRNFRTLRFNLIQPDFVAPGSVADLAGAYTGNEGEAQLSWHTPGDNGATGTFRPGSQYRIQYSTQTDAASITWSTAAAQITVPAGGAVPDTQAHYTLSHLMNGTSYYFRIWYADAQQNWGALSNGTTLWVAPDTTAPSAVTDLSAVPGVSVGQIRLAWTMPGDNGLAGDLGNGATFRIQYSSSTDVVWSSSTAQVSLSTAAAAGTRAASILTGLAPGTSYFIRLWVSDEALNWSGLSNAATAQAKIFPPNCPGSFAGTVLSTCTVRWSWTDNESYEAGYRVMNATGGIVAALEADTTSWTEADLTPNTSYFRYVECYNAAGSSVSAGVMRYTFANPPADVSFTGVYISSIAFNWLANDNPPSTRWVILRSTDDFVSTTTLKTAAMNYTATTYEDIGLLSQTSYYYKVQAWNADDVATAFGVTLSTFVFDVTPPSAVTDLTANSGIASGEIALRWTMPGDDGMSDTLSDGSGYAIQYSTDAAAVWSRTSAQVTASTSGVVLGTVVTRKLVGLTVGATYYIHLWVSDEALNWSGLSNATTAQAKIFPPNCPGSFAGTVLSTCTVRWSWTDNESYEAGYRVMNATGGIVAALEADTTSWTETDLTPNTSYFRYVECYNVAGSSVSDGASRYTFANPPASLDFTGVYISSIAFNWLANDNPPSTRWAILRSTDDFVSTTTLKTCASGYTQTNYMDTCLAAPATYYYRVQAFNSAGIPASTDAVISAFLYDNVPPAAVNTLTAQPGPGTGEIQLSWRASGDDGGDGILMAGAGFNIHYATFTGTGLTPASAQVTISTEAVEPSTMQRCRLTSLVPGCVYHINLWTSDEAGNWSAISNETTAYALIALPARPAALSGVALSTGSIEWRWTDSSDNETSFALLTSTGGIIATLPAGATSFTETGLLENSCYTRFVSAANIAGSSELSPAKSVYTLVSGPLSVSVSSSAVHSVALAIDAGRATACRVDVSTDAVSWSVALATAATTHAAVAGLLPESTYYFAVSSYNGDYQLSSTSAVASGYTQVLTYTVIPSTAEVTQAVTKVVDGAVLETRTVIPDGTVSVPVYVKINNDALSHPEEADPARIAAANDALTRTAGRTLLPYSVTEFNMYDLTGDRISGVFQKDVTISISYLDANHDGLVDNTVPAVAASRLRVFVLNEATGEWEQVGGTVIASENRVEVKVHHFSVYSLVGAPAASDTLAHVTVYPNPFQPGSGTSYDSAAGMVFDHLTSHATVRIYTIAGDLVFEGEEDDGDGKFTWNGCNRAGQRTASGVYVYLITDRDDTSKKARGKLAVIR